MTNMFTNNSNPSGYDTKYCGSYVSSDNTHIYNEYNLIKSEVKSELEIKVEEAPQLEECTSQAPEYIEIELDSISTLKINFILNVITRKLKILHRITKNKTIKKSIPDSRLIEREIEKRATLNIVDMLTLLKIANKDNSMSTQQRVVLLSEINKKAKLSVDEKIVIVNRLIAMDIIKDTPSKKHMSNKLILLYIVKESGFSIDVTKTKGYKPVMQSVEEAPVPADDNINVADTTQEEALKTELTEEDTDKAEDNDKSDKNDNQSDDLNGTQAKASDNTVSSKNADKKSSSLKQKKLSQALPVTKAFVNSKRHFKFGAGYIASNKNLSLLLPSGYVLDNTNKVYQSNNLRSDNKHTERFSVYFESPLTINFIKTEKSADYTLFDFFNSNIIECKTDNLKYRQTVISKSPAVLKHRSGDNIYTASIFIKNMNCVYDVQFKFKKTVANTASTVNRILASIKFEGM